MRIVDSCTEKVLVCKLHGWDEENIVALVAKYKKTGFQPFSFHVDGRK